MNNIIKTAYITSKTVDDSNNFSTYDLGCAAALLSVGHQVVRLNRDNPRKIGFEYELQDGLADVAEAYFNDTLNVRARRYFDSLKALKNRIYGER